MQNRAVRAAHAEGTISNVLTPAGTLAVAWLHIRLLLWQNLQVKNVGIATCGVYVRISAFQVCSVSPIVHVRFAAIKRHEQ